MTAYPVVVPLPAAADILGPDSVWLGDDEWVPLYVRVDPTYVLPTVRERAAFALLQARANLLLQREPVIRWFGPASKVPEHKRLDDHNLLPSSVACGQFTSLAPDIIHLHVGLMNDPAELVATVAHELRHLWHHERFGAMDKAVGEADARSYEANFMRRFYARRVG